tara:strand:+ start:166 stop:438 length:273 start_codon:yes stop_codon:yes gene_type:complete
MYSELQYKIDNIPVKEIEIKFLATLENGETIDLSRFLCKKFSPDQIKLNLSAFWQFSDRCCEMFGKDGNLPLSGIEDYAELHRDEILEEK